jgi:hypothetical protein
MKALVCALSLTVFVAVTGTAAAQSSGSGMTAADKTVEAIFTALEKRLIREYYGERHRRGDYDDGGRPGKKGKKNKGMPPGLAKKKDLPPGLERQLERNGKLPPGLEKRRLPGDLEHRLPRRDRRYERVIVDNDVVLIETATNIVLDILVDVLNSGN